MTKPISAKTASRPAPRSRRLSEPEIQEMHADMIQLGKEILARKDAVRAAKELEVIPAGESSESGPHDRITWGCELAIGLDRLKYGLHVEWKNSELLDILTDFKNLAHEKHQSVPCVIPGLGFEMVKMETTGRKGGFTFRISAGDVQICFSTRRNWMETPNLWIDIGSHSCWSPCYDHVIDIIEEFVEFHGGKIHKMGISEVHLCADCIGIDINTIELRRKSNWITRANLFDAYEQRKQVRGVRLQQNEGRLGLSDARCDYFGEEVESGLELGQGDIMLRVYDKVLEINRDGVKQSLFASVWNKEQYNDQPVTRVEFQLRRPVLRQLGVDTFTDLMSKLSGLWEYCTCNWAVLCAEAVDRDNRHQERAARHAWWLQVQKADWGSYQPVIRKKLLPRKDKHQLADQMIGCGLNLAVIERADQDVESIIKVLQQVVEDSCRAKFEEIGSSGYPVLLEKMKRKYSEIWPYGVDAEVHGA